MSINRLIIPFLIRIKYTINNKHIKGKFKEPVTKITRDKVSYLINNAKTSDKQKNHILKQLNTFFNWCVKEEIIIKKPTFNVKRFKVEKVEMKYWTTNEITTFFNFINNYIEQETNLSKKETAYRTKILTLIGFILSDRIGETRALSWNCINREKMNLSIKHSINYDTSSDDFVKITKTYYSNRDIDITQRLVEELDKYRYFLENELEYDRKDDDLIFFNYKTKKPLSDTTLRKKFYDFSRLAGVSDIRMYDLRHTYVATMMTEEKKLYLISERLGHTSYSTTVNKYGHLSNQIRKEMAEITDKYI